MNTTLTPRTSTELRLVLERERHRLRHGLSSLAEAERLLGECQGDESSAGGGIADVASDLTAQGMQVALERAERERLIDVEAALRRIDDGHYGFCERCGHPVETARLMAIPLTRYCIRCAYRQAATRGALLGGGR